MNIWIVNPFEGLPGESLRLGRYRFLAKMLADKEHKITWWSSNFCHTTKSFRSQGQAIIEVNDNWRIILLKTPKYGKNISLRRIVNHYVYARALRTEGRKRTEAPDIVLASSIPLLAASTALVLAKRFGAKIVIDVPDLWPESFMLVFPNGLKPIARILLLPLELLANRIYNKADGIIAISQTLLQRAISVSKNKSKESMVIPIAVDLALYKRYEGILPKDTPFIKHNQGEFRATFVGTIGKAYDLKTILEAADRLANFDSNIKLFIAGTGPDYDNLRSYANRKNLTNVTFTGLLDYHSLVHLLGSSDIGLNAIAPCQFAFPTKFFDYLAAGLPIVNSVEGELGHLVKTENIGIQYQSGNADSLVKAILELYNNSEERLLMGQRARKLAEERFDMNMEYPKVEELLRRLVSTI
ncbi:glycosyltransferase family 4 protein [Chloroflexota bacterium]